MGTQLQGWPQLSESQAANLAVGERRRSDRQITVLQVAKLITHHCEELCIVRDISAGGLRAEIYCRVQVRDRVWVQFKSGHEIAGRIAWTEDQFAGIAFDQPIDTAEILVRRDKDLEGRPLRAPRLRVAIPGTLRVRGEQSPVQLCDISQHGCRLRTAQLLKPGTGCEIALAGLGFRTASVRWGRDGEAGVMFHERLSYPDFALWRHRASATR